LGNTLIGKIDTPTRLLYNRAGRRRQLAPASRSKEALAVTTDLINAMADLDEERVGELIAVGLVEGVSPDQLLRECREGITLVGERFEAHEYYLSELIIAGAILKSAAVRLVALGAAGAAGKGRIVIGTVHGDIHDIGKDIVVTMLRGAGYDVTDLGVDVPPLKFVQAVEETGAPVVGLSCLLTTSFDPMRETVRTLRAASLPVKIMIGGGPVTEGVRAYVGADALGADAQAAVSLVSRWLGAREAA
jgi:5-methyltetrahydrofolate--homocysteine methyltransferase